MAAKKKSVPLVKDLRIPDGYTLEKTGITQSLLSRYLMCPMSFLFSVNRWKDAQTRKNTALGSVAHNVIAGMYNAGKFNEGDMSAGIETDLALTEGGYTQAEEEMLKSKLFAMLMGYFKHYRKDFTEKKFIEVERTFEVQFAGVTLRGKKDAVFKAKDGKRWVMEHKTKSRINEDTLMLKLGLDLQNNFYLLADSIDNKGEYAAGVLYNVLRVPEVKKFDKPKEVYEYAAGLIAKEPDHYFKRWEVPFTSDECRTFRQQLTMVIQELQDRILNGDWYRNPCACEAPFACPYLQACASGTLVGYTQSEKLFMELDE